MTLVSLTCLTQPGRRFRSVIGPPRRAGGAVGHSSAGDQRRDVLQLAQRVRGIQGRPGLRRVRVARPGQPGQIQAGFCHLGWTRVGERVTSRRDGPNQGRGHAQVFEETTLWLNSMRIANAVQVPLSVQTEFAKLSRDRRKNTIALIDYRCIIRAWIASILISSLPSTTRSSALFVRRLSADCISPVTVFPTVLT